MTYKCYWVIASGSYNTKPLHHSVLHQGLSIRFQSLDGDVLDTKKHTTSKHYSSLNVLRSKKKKSLRFWRFYFITSVIEIMISRGGFICNESLRRKMLLYEYHKQTDLWHKIYVIHAKSQIFPIQKHYIILFIKMPKKKFLKMKPRNSFIAYLQNILFNLIVK